MNEMDALFSKKQIRTLLIPLMIEQILTTLVGTADTMMVSKAGAAAISAVSLVDSINVFVVCVLTAIASGGAVVCAQYLGRGDHAHAEDTASQILIVIIAISAAATLLLFVLRRQILAFVFGSVESAVMAASVTYFEITALSYPFIGLYSAGAAILRVEGDTRLALRISLIANVLNIFGNAVLIFGLRMGVAGAAISTVISRILSAAAMLAALRVPGRRIVIRDYLRIRPDIAKIRRIMTLAIPFGLEDGLVLLGNCAYSPRCRLWEPPRLPRRQ